MIITVVIHVFPDLYDGRYMHLLQKFIVLLIISKTLSDRQYPDGSLFDFFLLEISSISHFYFIFCNLPFIHCIVFKLFAWTKDADNQFFSQIFTRYYFS